MKNIYKLISLLLAVVMVLSAITALFTVEIFADDSTTTGGETGNGVSVDHLTHYFATPEEKIATMKLAYQNDGVSLYVDSVSGEVAYVNEKTGEKLFTNPYDVASTTGNAATKYEILSQIIVEYKKTTAGLNDPVEKLNSFVDASERGQITVENIKGGVRVEYAIGREQSKMLVPRLISMERFEEMIIAPLLEEFGTELYNPRSDNPAVFDVQKMLSYYMVYSVDALDRNVYSNQDIKNMENIYGGLFENLQDSDAQYARALKQFPIIETMDVYVFDPKAGEKELAHAEEIITKYCPEYTYEELAYDHILTEYQSDDSNPPLFRMALEYKITADGLQVTLPANGIRFNESLYTLESIQILPYMGAGNTAYDGYNFFPDGSGALFDFKGYSEQISVEGKVYGDDYTRSEISGKYQNAIRYPVFGIVEETVYYTYERYDKEGQLIESNKIAGNIVEAIKANQKGETVAFCNGQAEGLASQYASIINASSTSEKKTVEKRGFICIIEEGDALASLTTLNEPDAKADYSTIKVAVTPRPKDKFTLEGADGEIPVVSERKYVGNYTMKYITLSDAEKATADVEVYDASWFGMAVAYRDYLTNKGIISKLSSDEITSDIPLYIETFGAIETTEKILSIPVTVMAPLTTFEQIDTIYQELSAKGMKNINFKLTGYANGGMWYTIPGNLKFEQVVGGNEGFQELLDKANQTNKNEDENFGIFPDFDFAYVKDTNIFSGYSAYKHNAKTIDDRYASKREWSATQQKYVNYFEMVVSPAYFVEFYEKLKKNYADKYDGEIGISVSTLGNSLNSDFDEDEPYNREDSKQHTIEAFQHFDTTYGEVMTDGGNAFTWKYVDHMLGVALDSSRYNFAARSVPFVGVVLHGSINFAGEPLNMEGDLQYAMLKAIENGASPYFVLSFDNTDKLKEDPQLSKYYSIRWDIWKTDIGNTYNTLNDVLFDVQDKYIVGHSFLTNGVRIPDSVELYDDIALKYELLLSSYKNAAELLKKEAQMAASIARENGRIAEEYAAEAIVKVLDLYNSQSSFVRNSAVFGADFYQNLRDAYAEYCKVVYSNDPAVKEQMTRIKDIYEIIQDHNLTLAECQDLYDEAYNVYTSYLDGANYTSYKEIVTAAYADYAAGKLAASQINYAINTKVAKMKLDAAIDDFKAGDISKSKLLEAINVYGAAYIDTKAYDEAVNSYLNGNIAHDKLLKLADIYSNNKDNAAAKKAFNDAADAYAKGTLAESALTSDIETWYDSVDDGKVYDDATLSKAIDSYKSGKLNASKLTETIGMYFFNKLDRSELLQSVESLKEIKSLYDTAKNNYMLEAIAEADLAELEKAYKSAKTNYDRQLKSFKNSPSLSRFSTPLKKYNEAKLAYELGCVRANLDKTDAQAKYEAQLEIYEPICNNVVALGGVKGFDSEIMQADVQDFMAKVDLLNKYLAAKDAFEGAKSSGFTYTFEDCYEIYYNKHTLSIYEKFGTMLKSSNCSADDSQRFYDYYDANAAVKALENDIEGSTPATGEFDNYLRALAVYDHLCASREELEALNADKYAEDLAKYENIVKSTRRTALTNTAAIGLMLSAEMGTLMGSANLEYLIESTGVKLGSAIGSTSLKQMQAIYEEARQHAALAQEAIYVLAESEKYEIAYLEGKPHTLEYMDTEAEGIPFVVKQAIERAKATYYAIEEDSFVAIVDGIKTEYTHNGETVYQSINNSNLYYYGTYEEGYQYLKKTVVNGVVTFTMYTDNLSNVSATVNGNRVYFNSKNEFGDKVYFTIAGGKMTYYIQDKDVYIEKSAIVYDGELFKTLRDGTEIYKDGDVYYSVDAETGEYTRYTYSQSIKSCYEEMVAENERVMEILSLFQSTAGSSDENFLSDILSRIDINERITANREAVEETVEESKYATDNVVAVTYGNADGSAYKTIILNYNNYDINIEYKGIIYTIPAYYFVVHANE